MKQHYQRHVVATTLRRVICRSYESIPEREWINHVISFQNKVQHLLHGNLHKDPNHPIFNFIFMYYFTMNPKCLSKYSPGMDKILINGKTSDYANHLALSTYGNNFVENDYILNAHSIQLSDKKRLVIKKTLNLLVSVDSKPPFLNCFGLHEWAMVYSKNKKINTDDNSSNVKHVRKFQTMPLRVSPDIIQNVLEPKNTASPLRCSHYDAVRFFTQDSLPLNGAVIPAPSRENVASLDQPGCIHVHMDLFKWAFKIFPLVSSNLLLDALDVAISARKLDMRASPYDLFAYQINNDFTKDNYSSAFDFDRNPIRIETMEGRKEYQMLQVELYHKASPVRKKLIQTYRTILTAT